MASSVAPKNYQMASDCVSASATSVGRRSHRSESWPYSNLVVARLALRSDSPMTLLPVMPLAAVRAKALNPPCVQILFERVTWVVSRRR